MSTTGRIQVRSIRENLPLRCRPPEALGVQIRARKKIRRPESRQQQDQQREGRRRRLSIPMRLATVRPAAIFLAQDRVGRRE